MTLAKELADKHAFMGDANGGVVWEKDDVLDAINEAIERCESAILTVFPRNAAEERYGQECLAKLRAMRGE